MFDVQRYEIEIKHHVFVQAIKRGISPDLIEDTIRNGKIERFGNDRIRFVKRGSKRTLICVGEIRGLTLNVFTIEQQGEKR